MFTPFVAVLFVLPTVVFGRKPENTNCDVDKHGVCFTVSEESLTWMESRDRCQQLGGELANLMKTPLRKAVDKMAKKHRNKILWIGLENKEALNGELEHDCIVAVPQGRNKYIWQSAECSDSHHYLCVVTDLDDPIAVRLLELERMKGKKLKDADSKRPFAIIEKLNNNPDDDKQTFQGDIMLTPKLEEILAANAERRKRGAIWVPEMLWPNGEVFYQLNSGVFTEDEKSVLSLTMKHIEENSCIRFLERDDSTDNYVYITKQGGCWSYYGMNGGMQTLSLGTGCLNIEYLGVPVHELLHALGFLHEQARSDRNMYVTVKSDNIQQDRLHNFNKYGTINQGYPYDYKSNLHYNLYAFAMDPAQMTLEPTSQLDVDDTFIGQRSGMSALDIAELNALYGCSNAVVNGDWSQWSTFSSCSATCGGGTQTKSRECNSPPPSINPPGSPCDGEATKTRSCMDITCPTPFDEIQYTWQGCWYDKGSSELLDTLESTGNPFLIGEYDTRADPVLECANAAVHVGHDIFALRFGGKCYSLDTTVSGTLYMEGGESPYCHNGAGKTNSLDVYSVSVSSVTWGPWGIWSVCEPIDSSSVCLAGFKSGTMSRTRECLYTTSCDGISVETQGCDAPCEDYEPWVCSGNDLFVVITDDLEISRWEEANAYCSTLDSNSVAHLAVLSDPTTLADIQDLVKGLPSPLKNGYWVGCDDLQTEGQFSWLDNTAVDMSTGWQTGQPDNKMSSSGTCSTTGQDCCLLLNAPTSDPEFNLADDCCVWKKQFICQIRDQC